jgi:two-component system nitrogen regulation response regulator NtrX
MDALKIIRDRWPDTEVIIISGHANVDMAVKAVKFGAFDFLEKPLSLDKVLTVCRNAISLHRLKKENAGLKKAVYKDEIIGTSHKLRQYANN